MTVNEERYVRNLIREELSKSEVRGMITTALDNFLKERELRKRIRELSAEILEDFFRQMWQRKGFWQSGIKNG